MQWEVVQSSVGPDGGYEKYIEVQQYWDAGSRSRPGGFQPGESGGTLPSSPDT